ncbi:tumor necrosis factor receptor superfamily member 14-like isoform X1 [Oncorhynchus masou masou]|uniref:tumor necrosis factor receptor superfamily member 14-like isoform X1 n=1 Tax=Oncorhynchus masou masou TaxID=90313 RepID=UPI0031844709
MAQFESLIWTIPIILVFESIGSCIACGRAEYRIRDECCPMCSPGNRVHRHCTEFTSTSCVPCVDATFLDEPNGLMKCKVCTNCDPGLGFKVKQPCTYSSDTVCGTLEGFYCLDPTKDGCRAAQRHSSCKPGQYISHTGTTSTDTVCSDCTGDTYSDGSLAACQPHTQCDTLKLQQIKSGTHWSDSECGPQISPIATLVFSVVLGVLAVIAAVTTAAIMKRRRRKHQRSCNS